MRCYRALLAVGLAALGCCSPGYAEPALQLVGATTSLGRSSDGSPVEAHTFYAGEDVTLFASIHEPQRGGRHELLYKWIGEGGSSVGNFDAQMTFDHDPQPLWGFAHAGHFVAGHYRVELYVDGQALASDEFDVLTGSRFSEPADEARIREAARTLLRLGKLADFAGLAAGYRQSRERTASGNWKLALVYAAASRRLYAPADPHWERMQGATEDFLAREPTSATAVVLHAAVLYAHAWAWRGEGFTRDIPAPSYAHYRELLGQAAAVLDQHPQAGEEDPQWDALRVLIAREQGADTDAILGFAAKALQREPYYYPLHSAVANALLPRWGGSREALLEYVRMALAHSPKEGTQAYARIYYYVARASNYWPLDDLNQMGAKWPPMKQSLGELVRAYPSPFNLDIARAINCMGGDAPGYRALGRAATADVLPVSWWDTAEKRQRCNEWAFDGKQPEVSLWDRARVYWSFLSGFGNEFWSRLRLIALVAFFLIEGGLTLLRWGWSVRTQPWGSAPGGARAFNPMEYPRSYSVAAAGEPNFLRLAVWMIVLGAAVPYMISTAPSPDPHETETVIAGCIALGAFGVVMVLSRLSLRVVLTSQAITLRGLTRGVTVLRQDILQVVRHARARGPCVIDVLCRQPQVRPLRIPGVWNEDDAFRTWFDSLPSVARGSTADPRPGGLASLPTD